MSVQSLSQAMAELASPPSKPEMKAYPAALQNPLSSLGQFSKFPAELRVQIWTLVIVLDAGVVKYIDPYDITGEHHYQTCRQPALTAVCRLIRTETLPLYYKLNVFEHRVPIPIDNGSAIDKIYRAIKRTNTSIRDIAGSLLAAKPGTGLRDLFDWFTAIGPVNVGDLKDLRVTLPTCFCATGDEFCQAMPFSLIECKRKEIQDVLLWYGAEVEVPLPEKMTLWRREKGKGVAAKDEWKAMVLVFPVEEQREMVREVMTEREGYWWS